jgi:hypothetical protein
MPTFLQAVAAALSRVLSQSIKSPVLSIGALLAFGVLIPKRYGMDFLDIRLVLAYAFIPMLFVGPAITSAMRVGGLARSSMIQLYAHILAIFLLGWLMGLIVMILSLGTLNYVYAPPELLLPEKGVLTAYTVFSFAAVAFVASFGAYVALLFTPGAALNTLRAGFLALLLVFYVGSSKLPRAWQIALGNAFNTGGFLQTALIISGFLLLFASGLLMAMWGGLAGIRRSRTDQRP